MTIAWPVPAGTDRLVIEGVGHLGLFIIRALDAEGCELGQTPRPVGHTRVVQTLRATAAERLERGVYRIF